MFQNPNYPRLTDSQVTPHQSQQTPVVNLAAHATHQHVVLDSVEEFRQVHVDAMRVAMLDDPLHLLRSFMNEDGFAMVGSLA